jgi:hypothetical protein
VPAKDVILCWYASVSFAVACQLSDRGFGSTTDLEWSRSVVGAVVAFELLRLLQQAADACRAYWCSTPSCRHGR